LTFGAQHEDRGWLGVVCRLPPSDHVLARGFILGYCLDCTADDDLALDPLSNADKCGILNSALESMIDTFLALAVGIGLAAACGFRVFLPMLVVGIAGRTDLLTLAEGFAWIRSDVAITAFAIAAVLETGAYYFPWLDNLLDSVSTPAAVVAGVVVSAAFIQDTHPLLKWSTAIITGGGAAGAIKAGLVGLRLTSSAATGGAGNFVVATFEWISALLLAVLSIFLPLLAAFIAIVLVVFLVRFAIRLWRLFRNPMSRKR
jgi:hypothetical protein